MSQVKHPYQIAAREILEDIFSQTDEDSKIPMELYGDYIKKLDILYSVLPEREEYNAVNKGLKPVVHRMYEEAMRRKEYPGMAALEIELHKHNIELLSGEEVSRSKEDLNELLLEQGFKHSVGFINPIDCERAANIEGLPAGWEVHRNNGDFYYWNRVCFI